MRAFAGAARAGRWACVATAAWLAACSSDKPAADAGPDQPDAAGSLDDLSCQHISGTRIRRELRQHSDGTAEFLALHDSEIGAACKYARAADSSLRCLPLVTGAPVMNGTLMYQNDACTQPIARATGIEPEDQPSYLRFALPLDDDCEDTRFEFRTLGEELTIAAETNVYTGDGNCTPTPAGANRYFPVTGELAPGDFVLGTETWVGGRMRMRQVNGDDGSRWCDVLGDFEDESLDGQTCALTYGEDGAVRCLPHGSAWTLYLADTCMADDFSGVLSGRCGAETRYVRESTGSCLRIRMFTAGEKVTEPVYQAGGGCELVPEELEVFQKGPAVSATSFAEFTRVYRDVGKRLEPGELTDGVGLRLYRSQWRDTELDNACTFRAATEGVERCLPNSAVGERPVADVSSAYFSDPDCMTAVRVAVTDFNCRPGAPLFAVSDAQVFEVEGAIEDPIYYSAPESCALVDFPIYRLGLEVAPEMFVSGEIEVE
jgi:hypothetical protein